MNRDLLRGILAYPGLSKKEAEVYLASLEVGRPTPLSVSKETFLPRPSIYRIMEGLVEKGLMGKVKEGKHTIYIPEDPSSLLERLRLQTAAVQNAMSDLRELATIYKNRPTVRFFEGRESIKRIFEDIFHNEPKEVLAFTSIDDLYSIFPDYYSFFVKRRVKRGIKGRIIAPLDKEGEKLLATKDEELREIKFISKELAKKIGIIGGHMLIYKDRVALVSFDSDQTSVIIENKALASAQKALFETTWELIK